MKKIEKQLKRFTYALVKLEVIEIFGVFRLLGVKWEDGEEFLDLVEKAQNKFKKLDSVQRRNLLNIVESAAEPEEVDEK